MRGWEHVALLGAIATIALLAGQASASDGDVNVAVIDSGIDPDHAAFCEDQIEVWEDLLYGEDEPYDDHGHGTAVASRVGGQDPNGGGSPLGAYPCVDLHVYKVLNEQGTTSTSAVTQAIAKAVQNGADVISISLSGRTPSPLSGYRWASATGYAADNGVLVVSSAGNDGELPPPQDERAAGHGPSELYPGRSSPDALIVGASDGNGERASFSQRNPEMLAPGEDVRVADSSWTWSTKTGSGTSYSTPWVAGVAAKMLAEGAPHDPDWLKWVLLHSASDEVTTPYFDEGYGVLAMDEVEDALAVARGQAPVPPADHRDGEHAVSLALRSGLTAETPSGLLPPLAPRIP